MLGAALTVARTKGGRRFGGCSLPSRLKGGEVLPGPMPPLPQLGDHGSEGSIWPPRRVRQRPGGAIWQTDCHACPRSRLQATRRSNLAYGLPCVPAKPTPSYGSPTAYQHLPCRLANSLGKPNQTRRPAVRRDGSQSFSN